MIYCNIGFVIIYAYFGLKLINLKLYWCELVDIQNIRPYTALHKTAQHCTALHRTTLHSTALNCTNCTALHNTKLHCTRQVITNIFTDC